MIWENIHLLVRAVRPVGCFAVPRVGGEWSQQGVRAFSGYMYVIW